MQDLIRALFGRSEIIPGTLDTEQELHKLVEDISELRVS